MSELKARMLGQTMNEYGCDTKIYLKSEADKAIAELKDNLKVQTSIAEEGWKDGWKMAGIYHSSYVESVLELYEKNKEIRHHKYKRCLAMAGCCRLRARWFVYKAFYKKEQWALQWHKRWLDIADKFKEAK